MKRRQPASVLIILLAACVLSVPHAEAAGGGAASPPVFSSSHQLWDTGADILTLQQYLNSQGFLVAQTGPGSPGNETSLFGLHTYRALVRFQRAEGLPATGFLGPLTRAGIAHLAASISASNTTTTTTTTPISRCAAGALFNSITGASCTASTSPVSPVSVTPSSFGTNAVPHHHTSPAPTLPPAPVISAIIASSTVDTSATITWTTDEAASSTVSYGLTTSYGTASTSATLTTTHSITLTGLTPSTAYHFQVSSTDAAGNVATSSDETFTTTAYIASAVHFDGLTWLINAALASSDNGTASVSFWFRTTNTATINTIWAGDPTGAYSNFFAGRAGSPHWAGGIGTSDGLNSISSIGFSQTDGVWHHFLMSGDVRRGTPVLAQYLDGVLVGQPPLIVGSFSGTSTINFNGFALWVGADSFGNNLTGDLADLWIAPGVSLLDGSGDIATSTRRKLIDASGKPVDLGSDGSIPTGTAPSVFLSGNASSFSTNKGTGGAFTTTGTLTDATSSPSD